MMTSARGFDPAELIKLFQHGAKKSLGQNFLIDPVVLSRIAAAASKRAERVFEIGPGPGGLTQAILRHSPQHFVVLEKDSRAVAHLSRVFADQSVEVREGDALEDRWPMDESCEGDGPVEKWSVCGNLPYNVSTQIFFECLARYDTIERLVFMFQAEVAKRFCAPRKTKAYGVLSVVAQTFFDVHPLLDVAPECFRPVPKVNSSVVVFKPKSVDLDPSQWPTFRSFVKAAFASRRKTLPNVLQQSMGMPKADTEDILQSIGHKTSARPEALSTEDFLRFFVRLQAE